MKYNKNGFSIIETLIAIVIFAFGLVAVYALIISTFRANDYNQNYVIASNLAREQLEIFKNIRDENFSTLHNWNQIDSYGSYTDVNNFFSTGTYYTLSHTFNTGSLAFPFDVKIISPFAEGPEKLSTEMQSYRLCIDTGERYTYNCIGNTPSYFYRYLYVDEVHYLSGTVDTILPDAYMLTSKVIWYMRGYHEMEIKSMITDWKRL